MKKEIRLGFHSKVSDYSRQYYISFLSKHFTPVIEEKYDYYIAGEAIYWNNETMREFLNSDPDAIRIMGCGEAVYPDLNLFDYAIWHCGHYESDDRIIFDPLIRTELGFLIDDIHEIDNVKNNRRSCDILKEKEKFCNFIYSNPNAHQMRDMLFHKISEYKHVDSLGSHLNNIKIENTRYVKGWEKKSVELKQPYKFSIASENAQFKGYTSEKIMSSMLANTIPIYWGDPCVGEWFNEKSFVNVGKFDNLDDALSYIIFLDKNDSAYIDMMNEPWRTDEQIKACDQAIVDYKRNLLHVFEMDKKEAVRRPRGTWPDRVYPKVFVSDSEKKWKQTIKEKICGLVR